MAIYDTRYGLNQPVVDYLNQGLPSISGLFPNVPTTPVLNNSQNIPVGLTPEQLALLYPQIKQGTPFDDPYGVDPDNRDIRTIKDYSARPAYEAGFGTMMGDPEANITTGALNSSGVMGPYQEKPKSQLQEILEKVMPGKGIIDAIGSVLPVNRTGIMQNQMLGAGIMLDNIGRIVAAPGKYNTPEGIMAGYNLSARPQDFESDKNVYNKRTKNITETLLDKYKGNITREQIQEVIDEIEETGEYTGDITDESVGAQNLFSNLVNVSKSKFDLRNIQKNAELIKNYKQDKKDKTKRRVQKDKIQKRYDKGESSSDIGKSMFTGKGQAFEKQSDGYVSGKGTANERNYGGR